MAGPLDWLVNSWNQMRGPQAMTANNDPSTTYGPAQSRITRTPINFTNQGDQWGGLYDPNSNQITVNPNNTGDVGRTVRHESVHAVMSNPQVQTAANQGPQMQSAIASMPHFIGDPTAEAASYISQNQPGMRVPGSNITSNWPNATRNGALDEMMSNVRNMSPSSADQLQRLNAPEQDPTSYASVRTHFTRGQDIVPQGQSTQLSNLGKAPNTIVDSDNSENRSRY